MTSIVPSARVAAPNDSLDAGSLPERLETSTGCPSTAPVAVVRDADGKQVAELARADISRLKAAGWVAPESFTVKARDGIVNAAMEERRLRLAIDSAVATPDARAEGFGAVAGPRLALMASQVSDAFNTKTRIDPGAVWTDQYLPSKADLNVLPPVGKK